MKIENQIMATSGVDRKGERIPEDGIVALYKKMEIPQWLMLEHNTIAPPIGRILSKSLCIAICEHAVVDGKLDPERYKSPTVVCRSGEIQDGKKVTEEDILDFYCRLDLPSLPDPSTASLEKPWVESKILAIAGDIEMFDEERAKGVGGMSIGYRQTVKVVDFSSPTSDGKVDKYGRQIFNVIASCDPHMVVSANPELFDIDQIDEVLDYSQMDFMIGVSPKHEKSFEEFPWIITIAFMASTYLSAFVGEIGRRHARGLGDWVRRIHANHESKAKGAIKWQLTTPLDIGDISIKLKIAIDAGQMSEFSWDEQKIIEEIERQTSCKITDILEVSISYLGEGAYRLEYAISRSGELIKLPE